MTDKAHKQSLKRYLRIAGEISSATSIRFDETPSDKAKRKAAAQLSYPAFCATYFPHLCRSGNGWFHNKAAKLVLANSDYSGLWAWARGSAKSTHVNTLLPLWLMIQPVRQLDFMLLIGKNEDNAIRLLADTHAELSFNQLFIHDWGPFKLEGSWAEGDFTTAGGVTFLALGAGQPPRGLKVAGRRPNYIALDDLDHRELVRNEERVRLTVDWLLEDVLGTFDIGFSRLVVVNNYWSATGVMAQLQKERPKWHWFQVDALKKDGKPNWPEKYGDGAFFRVQQDRMGYRAFMREYMNTPVQDGRIFKTEWIRWKKRRRFAEYSELICYIDPSYKATTTSDFKAAKLWGLVGHELHHLRAFVRKTTSGELVRWCYGLYEELQHKGAGHVQFWQEAMSLDDYLIEEFRLEGQRRGYQLPLRRDDRTKGNKQGRIEAMAGLWERGFVFYAEDQQRDPDMKIGLDQLMVFGPGSKAHDDGPDADEGAIYMLQRRSRTLDTPEPLFIPRPKHRI